MKALILTLLAGCASAPAPLPPAPPLRVEVGGCEGWRIEQRLELAGPVAAAIEGGGITWVATDTRVDAWRSLDEPPVARIPIEGEPRALLWVDDELWVAAGTGGVARVRDPLAGAGARVDQWGQGGLVIDLAHGFGRVWAADVAGRVLAIEQDAPSEREPTRIDVDGTAFDVEVYRDEIVVALGSAGAMVIDPSTGETRPLRAEDTYRLSTVGEALVLRGGGGLTWLSDAGPRTVPAPDVLGATLGLDSRVLAITRGAGALRWDGASSAAQAWWPAGLGPEVPVLALSPTADGALVAAGASGFARLSREGGELRVTARAPPTARLSGLHSLTDRVLAPLEWQEGVGGPLFTLTAREGRIHAERSAPAIPPLSAAEVEDGIAAGQDGLAITRADGSMIELLPPEVSVFDVVAPTPRRLLALLPDHGVVWFERADQGWTRGPFIPQSGLALGALGSGALVAPSEGGVAVVLDGPGASPRAVRLAGSPGDVLSHVPYTRPGELRQAGMARVGGRLWIALPSVGVQVIEADGRAGEVLRVPGGAVDVIDWGELLLVAMGARGVALLDPRRPEDPVIARCDLPGITMHVGRIGDQALAATMSTVFALGR